MTKTTFKRLIVFWWILGFAGIAMTLFTEKYLPLELSNYLAAKANADPTPLEVTAIIIGFALLLATIIGSIGLYFFRTWARDLFVLTQLIGLFLAPFFGPTVTSEWAAAISYLHAMVTGGLLFSLYLPPLSKLFPNNVVANDS